MIIDFRVQLFRSLNFSSEYFKASSISSHRIQRFSSFFSNFQKLNFRFWSSDQKFFTEFARWAIFAIASNRKSSEFSEHCSMNTFHWVHHSSGVQALLERTDCYRLGAYLSYRCCSYRLEEQMKIGKLINEFRSLSNPFLTLADLFESCSKNFRSFLRSEDLRSGLSSKIKNQL